MGLFSRSRESVEPSPPPEFTIRQHVRDHFPMTSRETRRDLFAIRVFDEEQKRQFRLANARGLSANGARYVAAIAYDAAIAEPLAAWDPDPLHNGGPIDRSIAVSDPVVVPPWYERLETGGSPVEPAVLDALAAELIRRTESVSSTTLRSDHVYTDEDESELYGRDVFTKKLKWEANFRSELANVLHLANLERKGSIERFLKGRAKLQQPPVSSID